MRSTVLCALTDDDHARDVVATGRALASAGRLEPLFVHVAPDLTQRARDEGMRLLSDAGVGAGEGLVLRGDPESELVRVAREHDAALIVVGSRGRGPVSSVLLGSVSRALALGAPCPVLIARPIATPDRGGPVVAGIDLREGRAESVARSATELAAALDRPLVFATVLDDERLAAALGAVPSAAPVQPTRRELADAQTELETLTARLTGHPDVQAVVLDGSPAARLDELAADSRADLVVVGNPRGGAVRRAIEGSVALDLLRRGRAPLVIVPSG